MNNTDTKLLKEKGFKPQEQRNKGVFVGNSQFLGTNTFTHSSAKPYGEVWKKKKQIKIQMLSHLELFSDK